MSFFEKTATEMGPHFIYTYLKSLRSGNRLIFRYPIVDQEIKYEILDKIFSAGRQFLTTK